MGGENLDPDLKPTEIDGVFPSLACALTDYWPPVEEEQLKSGRERLKCFIL